MFKMFGFGGASCPRCERKNPHAAGYCASCGLTLGAPRNPVVLRENRWMAGPDELAVFFGVRALSGIFVKTLRVPATARAWILQGEQATEVPQGEYEIEGFFTRLNHLLRDQHAEILVTRTAPLAVGFEFAAIATAEHLEVTVSLSVSIKVENVAAFARHFMTMPGTIGAAQLRELLDAPVRQVLAEFVGERSIRDMACTRALREQMDERVHGALTLLLAGFGLAVVQVETLALRHEQFAANRAQEASQWLAADARHAQTAHARQLDELALAGAEQAQALRARAIGLYAKVAESDSRRQAIERGAAEVLAQLEHTLAASADQRAGEVVAWAHVRELARIRMQAAIELAQQESLQARQLARQRFSHQLLQQQISNKIEQALAIEDASRQRAELVRLHEAQRAAARRERELEDAEHEARRNALTLAHAARRREAERVTEWEEELALGRKRALLRKEGLDAEEMRQQVEALRRGGTAADALAQHEKLLRTIDADALHRRRLQEVELDAEARRHGLRRQEQEAAWQHELRCRAQEQAACAARWTHEIELARMQLARNEAIGAMDDTARLALAEPANAQVLADYLKARTHAGMGAEQLAALAGMASAANSMTPQQALDLARELVREERGVAGILADKERRHQIDLLTMQNEVNTAALAAQAQLGAALAAPRLPDRR